LLTMLVVRGIVAVMVAVSARQRSA